MDAVIPLAVRSLETNCLAPRGCLVRVKNGTDQERWFAVGIYSQKMAEDAVCNLSQIEPSDIVFARRRLTPAEIEALALGRRQVIQCNVCDESKRVIVMR